MGLSINDFSSELNLLAGICLVNHHGDQFGNYLVSPLARMRLITPSSLIHYAEYTPCLAPTP